MSYLVTEDFVSGLYPDASNERVLSICQKATTVVAQYLRTSFIETRYEGEVLDSAVKLVPQHLPIVSVEMVEDLSGGEPVEITDFSVYSDHIIIPNASSTRAGIRLTYVAGLADTPEIFSLVAEDLVRLWAFKDGRLEELFYKSEEMEDRKYSTRELTEESILRRLAGYRYSPNGASRGWRVRIGVI